MKIKEFLSLLEEISPLSLSSEFCLKYGAYDNSGIIVDTNSEIKGVVFSLDLTKDAVLKAVELNYNLIVTHHPAIYKGIKSLSNTDALYLAIKNGIGVISMHLNLDSAPLGIDYYFAKGLGANESVSLLNLTGGGYGRTFTINKTLNEIVENYKKEFESDKVFAYGLGDKVINKVSSFCGAGFSEDEYALSLDSDLIVSADIPHHLILKVIESGRAVLQVTHYASEIYGFKKFYEGINFANKTLVDNKIYK